MGGWLRTKLKKPLCKKKKPERRRASNESSYKHAKQEGRRKRNGRRFSSTRRLIPTVFVLSLPPSITQMRMWILVWRIQGGGRGKSGRDPVSFNRGSRKEEACLDPDGFWGRAREGCYWKNIDKSLFDGTCIIRQKYSWKRKEEKKTKLVFGLSTYGKNWECSRPAAASSSSSWSYYLFENVSFSRNKKCWENTMELGKRVIFKITPFYYNFLTLKHCISNVVV